MFKAKIDDPSAVVGALKAAHELVKDEVTFKIGEGGIVLRAMDPANVAMVIIELDKKVFDDYQLAKESFVGINMERFMQVLKRSSSSDKMELKISGGKMEIVYRGRGVRRFSLPLLALESGPRPEPDLNFSVLFNIETDILKEAIEDTSVVSDAITVVAANDELHLLAQGDLGDVETIIKDGEGITKMDLQEKARSKYSIEYLKKISKTRIGDSARAGFKSDYPLKLQFSEPGVDVGFILAPRMDVE